MTDTWRTIHSVIKPSEREWLVALAADVCARFEKPVFVNIGVSRGCSMHCLRAGCARARLVGVDINFKYRPVVAPNELRAEMICADSQVCHVDFDGPIHLLFVDGSHRLDSVAGDTAGWTPKVVEGGVVAFHDYHYPPPPKSWVKLAVDAWLEKEGDLWESIASVKPMKAMRRRSL